MVDVVLLALVAGKLHVGLARRLNPDEPFFEAWTLPGGFVRTDEDADAEATARRVLREKAGVSSPYLEQLYSFTGAFRDSRGWSASIGHYALVPAASVPVDSAVFKWAPVDEVSKLPFDHMRILQMALERVRSKTSYSSLPIHLAPETFTMAELRKLYEQVLGGAIPGRTFERYIEQLDVLELTGETRSSGGKPAKVYRVKTKKSGLAKIGPSLQTR